MSAQRAPSPAPGFTLIEVLVALFITAIIFTMGYGALNQALKDREALQSRQQRLTAVQTALRVMVQDFSQVTPRPVRDQLGQGSLACFIGQAVGQTQALGSSASSGLDSGLGSSLGGGAGGSGLSGTSGGLGSTHSGLGGALGLGSSSSSSSSSSGLGSLFSSSSSSASASSSSSTSASGSSTSSGSGEDLVIFTRAGWANPAGVQRPALERVSYRLEDGKLRRMHWPELDITETSAPIARDLLDHVKSVTFRYLNGARQWSDQWPPAGTTDAFSALRMRPLAVEVTLELEDWGRIVRIIEVPA